jgi:hypothetical protein
MKKLVLITTTAVLLIVAGGCTTGRMASTGVYYDDIYYAPDLTKENMEQAFAPVPDIAKEEKKEIKKEERELVREYERSELDREQRDTRDFSEIQEKYASILADEDTEEVDTMIYYNDETGYWVNGFDGSEMDRDYAERLIRFHGPFTRIPYWSPLYDQFVYFNDPDWNVYVDGNYAYAFPHMDQSVVRPLLVRPMEYAMELLLWLQFILGRPVLLRILRIRMVRSFLQPLL